MPRHSAPKSLAAACAAAIRAQSACSFPALPASGTPAGPRLEHRQELPSVLPAGADPAAGRALSRPYSPVRRPWQGGASGPGGSAPWSARPAARQVVLLRTAFSSRCSSPSETPRTCGKGFRLRRLAAESADTGPQRCSRYTFRQFPPFYTVPVLFPAHKEPVRPLPALPRGCAARWHWQTARGRFRQRLPVARPLRGSGIGVPRAPGWPCSIRPPGCCWACPAVRPARACKVSPPLPAGRRQSSSRRQAGFQQRCGIPRRSNPGGLQQQGRVRGLGPNTRRSHPAAASRQTPASGKASAPAQAQGAGKATTRSAPPCSAACTRTAFRQKRHAPALGSPQLMATATHSHPAPAPAPAAMHARCERDRIPQ